MRYKLFLLFFVLLLFSSPVALFADQPYDTSEYEATYTHPNYNMADELAGKYNCISAVRMSFPDSCLAENQNFVDDILSGERGQLLAVQDGKELKYLYGYGIYLMPLQTEICVYEFYKLGLPNPYFSDLMNKLTNNPKNPKGLKQLYSLYYNIYNDRRFFF